MKKILSKITLITAFLCAAAAANVTVVESTPSRIVLLWEMSGFDTVSLVDGQGLRTHVSYDGGYVFTGDSGAAHLPGFSIHAGVPAQGVSRVSIEPLELSQVRHVHPLWARDFATGQAAPVFSSRWISEPSYLNMRDYRVAHLVLRPVYGTGNGRLQLLTKARVVIEFDRSAHTGVTWNPRDDFERMVQRLLVNFDAAQGWQERRASRKAASAGSTEESLPFGINQTVARFRVGDGHRRGNEGTTKENGLIKVSGRRIREIFGQNVPIDFVSLYASKKGEMDVIVPGLGYIPTGVSEIPLLRYDFNGNGIVDDDDLIIAYVSGASDWTLDAGRYDFSLNRYHDYRYYWLAVKDGPGAVIETADDAAPPSVAASETFEENLYVRSPSVLSRYNSEGGIDFAWRRFTLSRPDTSVLLDLTGIDESQPGSIRIRTGKGEGSNRLDMSLNSETICVDCGSSWITVDSWGAGELTLRYSNSNLNPGSYYEVNGVHVRYQRFLRLTENEGRLEIFSPDRQGSVRYALSVSGGTAYVVRVPLDDREVALVGVTNEPYFEWGGRGASGVRYMAVLEKDIVDYSDSLEHGTILTVGGAAVAGGGGERYLVRDLRAAANKTDYIIVTHEDFLGASLRLAEHKEFMGFERPAVVLLGDIMKQFGGGNIDPAAIRNFLLYVYRNWDGGDAFSYVLLNGAGHYDYKNVVSRAQNFMPIPYLNRGLESELNEDFYVSYDTTIHPNSQHSAYYFIGRLPSKSLSESFAMVDKIIETEDPRVAEFDAWRNRALMSADDDQQGASRDNVRNHHVSSERCERVIRRLRPETDMRTLYLFEYEWDERFFKPGATRAFINEINNGVAIVNWLGHGSIGQLADENLLARSDVAALHNRKRYPLFTLFTCSAGKFDQPNEESIAELLMRQAGAGASTVITAAREVYADRNEGLAISLFEALFDTTSTANLSFGSALRTAKHRYNVTTQNRYFLLFGDPSLTYFDHRRRADLAITASDGARLDTLKALQQITITGTVRDAYGTPDASFGGSGAFADIILFNPPQDSARRKDGGKFTDTVYTLPGTPVFSARVPVTNGEFEQQILLPMNLTFGKPGVRLTAYVWNREGTTGTGHIGGLIFEGSESGGFTDTTGPRISVRPVFNNSTIDQAGLFVKNRVTSQLPLTMEIAIEDESGINVIGSGPDEGLTVEVTGAMSKRGINHLFRFSEGSFRQGIATMTLEENTLRSGTHEMIISAQDLVGNVSRLTVALDIVDPADLKLDHVINVPNPVKMGRETRFYYNHSNAPGDLDVNVTIRIYSLGGRLLYVIRNPRNGEAWVPRDQAGNLLTPNVYLYQVTATSSNLGRTVKSKIKKLVVHPPR